MIGGNPTIGPTPKGDDDMSSVRTTARATQAPPPSTSNRRDPDRLTAREVAEILGCHPDTVYQWADQQVIPARRASTGRWWFSRRRIETYAAERSQVDDGAAGASAAVPSTTTDAATIEPGEAEALSHDLASMALRLARFAGRGSRS